MNRWVSHYFTSRPHKEDEVFHLAEVCVCVCVCVYVCMCIYFLSCSIQGLSYTWSRFCIYICPVFPSVVHSLPLTSRSSPFQVSILLWGNLYFFFCVGVCMLAWRKNGKADETMVTCSAVLIVFDSPHNGYMVLLYDCASKPIWIILVVESSLLFVYEYAGCIYFLNFRARLGYAPQWCCG